MVDRNQYRKTTHRDHVFKALIPTPCRLVRKDAKGLVNHILDGSDTKVGEVNFDAKENFLGGTLYGKIVVKGRAKNASQAMSEFVTLCEELHG